MTPKIFVLKLIYHALNVEHLFYFTRREIKMSKGSKPRPMSISRKEYKENYDKIFKKKLKKKDY